MCNESLHLKQDLNTSITSKGKRSSSKNRKNSNDASLVNSKKSRKLGSDHTLSSASSMRDI